jgi:hypothetical protein
VTDYKYTDSFSPDSTLVSVAYYHRGEQNLFVKFSGNGLYGYSKVPSWTWDAFIKAGSAGNYYNTNIKGKFNTFMNVSSLTFIGAGKAAESNTHKFVLVGHSPVEYTFEGTSLEDAKADFERLFPNGVLKEVRVHFE